MERKEEIFLLKAEEAEMEAAGDGHDIQLRDTWLRCAFRDATLDCCIAALTTVVFAACVLSASAQESVLIMGEGARTCAQFSQDYKHDARNELAYFTWAQGFMSGLNSAQNIYKRGAIDLNAKSVNDQKAMVREYCDRNPTVPFAEAASNVWASMAPGPPKN